MRSMRVALALLIVLAAIAWSQWPRPRSAVDWSEHPVVVLQSDDWGLCAWLPDSTRSDELVEEIEGWGIYQWAQAYHRSTLESADDVDRIVDVLGRHRGADGQPAVLQANTIVAAPDYARIEELEHRRMVVQTLGAYEGRWRRPGLLDSIRRGMEAGVWYPEYHGWLHINGDRWLELLRENDPETRRMFEEECLLNDEWSDEYEYDADIDFDEREQIFLRGMETFEQLFDRRAVSTIAPDYAWPDDQERIFRDAGIRIVQGWRAQTMQPTGVNRIVRAWRRLTRPMGYYDEERDLLYLVRNVHFEPIESPDAVDGALRSVEAAWSNAEPAVVSTHRVSYARLDLRERDRSLEALDRFLAAILEIEPRTVFLTDAELAQLYRTGTSVLRIRSDQMRLRNYLGEPVILKLDLPPATRLQALFALTGSSEAPESLGLDDAGRPSLRLPPGDFVAQLVPTETP